MNYFEINHAGKYGIIADQPAVTLPPGAWSSGSNIRCRDGVVSNAVGYQSITTGCSGTALYILSTTSDADYYYYFPTTTAISEWNGSACSDRTRQSGGTADPYTGTADDRWNGGVLNGVVILNNGKDSPQYLATPGSGNFANLIWDGVTDWATQSVTAKVIRPYRNFLFAFDVTESGTRDHTAYLWSNPADPGSTPDSWDYTDSANIAGKGALSETGGRIIDALPFGQDMVVYKDDAIYIISYIGGNDVFSERLLTQDVGILSQHCFANIGSGHIILTQGDVVYHNGQTIESIADQTIRKALFGELNSDAYARSFLVHNRPESEVWVCYPITNDWPTKAAIYNYRDRTWTFRDIPDATPFIALGTDIAADPADLWSGQTDTWLAVTGVWSGRNYNPSSAALHGVAGAVTYKWSAVNTFAGDNPACIASRDSIVVEGLDTVKEFQQVIPHMEGGPVDFYVAGQLNINDSINWSGPFSFDPESDYKIDVRTSGRMFCYRIEARSGQSFKFRGCKIGYRTVGYN
jgi:hypothetical protein